MRYFGSSGFVKTLPTMRRRSPADASAVACAATRATASLSGAIAGSSSSTAIAASRSCFSFNMASRRRSRSARIWRRMSSVDEPPAPPPPARLDDDAFFLAASASSAARRAFFFSSSSALVPSVLPWPLNFCVEFCGCSVGGETAVSAMGTSGRSDGTFALSSQLISCGAKSPDPAGSGAHLAEDGLVHLLTVHIEAGTKTRVETLACRVGGDEDAGGNPAACLARGLSADGPFVVELSAV